VFCTGGSFVVLFFSWASRGFQILACGKRRVLEVFWWRSCSKLDLVNSADFPLTRTLLLRSLAFSDHDGCLMSPCGVSCLARDLHAPGVSLSTLAHVSHN